MATKVKPKPRTRRSRQKHLPGMEPPSIKQIDDAADSYREARDARMEQQKAEMEAHFDLLELMKTHGLTAYDYDGFTVTVVASSKVKVRRKNDPDDSGA